MDSEIKKITLEVEEKAAKNAGGIDSLINSLTKLNTSVSSSTGKLKSLSGGFDTLSKSISSVNRLNFTGLQTSLNSLTNSINKLNNASFGKSIGDQLKSVSSGVNSVKNSFSKLEKIAPVLNNMDISGFTSNIKQLGQLSKYGKSFTELKNGAQDFNKALTSLNKASDKLPSIITKFNELDLTKFTQQVGQLSNSLTELSKAMSATQTSAGGFSKTMNSLPTVVTKTNKAVTTANKNLAGKGLFGGVNTLANFYMIQQIGRAFAYPIQQANDFIETMNLFNVVMGESGQKAVEFIRSLETIGVNQEQAMRFQSSFYDIAKSMGVATDNAYTLSEQFTKLTYDYASLYNMNIEESFYKLQSAITGEIEPIRRLGKDISETRLQQVAWDLGIQQSVRSMDQASKAELRFIAIMQQSGAAMNDMERTINNPANALRVLRAQFVSLAREIGSLFIPIVTAVLPYLIAIVKVIRDIVAAIAGLFGVKLMTIEFEGIGGSVGSAAAGAGDLADNAGTASDNLGSAADNAKKLKNYMLGIDELNVLDSSQSSASGGAGGGGGVGTGIGGGSGLGLDLSDFGYAKVLDQVKSKADEIYEVFAKWKPLLIALAAILAAMWATGKIMNFIRALKGLQAVSTLAAGASGLGALFKKLLAFTGAGGLLATVGWWFVALGDSILTFLGITTGSVVVAGLVGFAAVLAVVAAAAVAIYVAMQPAIKQVDEFANVSEKTKEKLQPVIDTWKSLETEIHKLDWTNKVITQEDIDSIINKVDSMVEAVLNEVDADRNQALQDIELLAGVEGISDETYTNIIDKTNSFYNDIVEETEESEARIKEILTTAKNEKRDLKDSEVKEIQELQRKIRDNAVQTMSESEKEQMLIMTRLKHNTKALAVESASELLQEAKKNTENQLKEAEDWRTRMLNQLDLMYGDKATMQNEEYAREVEAIEKAYDEQVKAAEEGYDEIYKEVEKGLGEQAKYIDEETGKIKSNWDIFWSTIADGAEKIWKNFTNNIKTETQKLKESWDENWTNIKEKATSTWNDLKTGSEEFAATVKEKIVTKTQELKEDWSTKWTTIRTTAESIWNDLKPKAEEFGATIKEKVATKMTELKDDWGTKWGNIQGTAKTIWNTIDGNMGSWLSEMKDRFKNWFEKKKEGIIDYWETKWKNLETNYPNVIKGISNWMSKIKDKVSSWLDKIREMWESFWEKLKADAPETNTSAGSSGPPQNAGIPRSVTAFAEGGFIPANSRFVPPENLWTAGEAGREVIGTFRSRPTVMPLENTGFVQAMYQAVYDATRSAYSENEMNIYIQPKVELDSKDIAQGQETYKYSSGVGLVKKMV